MFFKFDYFLIKMSIHELLLQSRADNKILIAIENNLNESLRLLRVRNTELSFLTAEHLKRIDPISVIEKNISAFQIYSGETAQDKWNTHKNDKNFIEVFNSYV